MLQRLDRSDFLAVILICRGKHILFPSRVSSWLRQEINEPMGGWKETIVLDVLGYEKSVQNIRNSTNHTAQSNDTRTDVSATLAVSRK